MIRVRLMEWLNLPAVQWVVVGGIIAAMAWIPAAAGLRNRGLVVSVFAGGMIAYGIFRFFVGTNWPPHRANIAYLDRQWASLEASPDFETIMAERDARIARARALPLLDAIVAVRIYNGFRLGPQPRAPDIQWSEVLPPLPGTIREMALRRADRMLYAASISFPGDEQLRQFKVALRKVHPGFSQDSYDAALHWGFWSMR